MSQDGESRSLPPSQDPDIRIGLELLSQPGLPAHFSWECKMIRFARHGLNGETARLAPTTAVLALVKTHPEDRPEIGDWAAANSDPDKWPHLWRWT